MQLTTPLSRLNKALVPFGAAYKITLSGDATDLKEAVFQLENFGAITGIPDDFSPGTDKSVTVNSYRKPFITGLRALVAYEMSDEIPEEYGFQAVETFRAARLLRSFKASRSIPWEGSFGQTYGQSAGFGARDTNAEE